MIHFPANVEFHIIVNNIEVGKGNIEIALYDSKKDFLNKPFIGKIVPASADSLEFSFEIPKGEYAVAVYQDVNKNNKLDKGLFSIPTEPYGFSNNYRPLFSSPSYDGCEFKVAGDSTIKVTLK